MSPKTLHTEPGGRGESQGLLCWNRYQFCFHIRSWFQLVVTVRPPMSGRKKKSDHQCPVKLRHISALGGTRAAPAILSGPAGTFGSDAVMAHELPSRLLQEDPRGWEGHIWARRGTRAAPAILTGPAGTFGSDAVVAHELPSRLLRAAVNVSDVEDS